jgi:flagellar protein FliO/FliZ
MTDSGDISFLHIISAFGVVLAMLGGLAYILKYVSTRGFVLPSSPARQRRMKIVESLAIDTKRRFVILSCDGREHLLLLNASQDIVIEPNLPTPPSPLS